MRFFIADAFTNELFGGNPAGVVLIDDNKDFPSDEIMIKTAAELRYSETAFIKTLDLENDLNQGDSQNPCHFQVRYFTPVSEVDLCGHATIASFYCLAKAGLITPSSSEAVAHTKAGTININVTFSPSGEAESIMMDMAEPKHIATISDAIELDRLYDIMDSEFDQSLGLMPMIISTGLPDIILPLSSVRELNRINPNFDALSKLSETYGVTGVHAFAFDGDSCHTRNFAPLYGIDEEAATGTASGALTYYLCLNQKIGIHDECRFTQGEKMGRPSEILTTIDAGEICKIRVGGKAAILAEGSIFPG